MMSDHPATAPPAAAKAETAVGQGPAARTPVKGGTGPGGAGGAAPREAGVPDARIAIDAPVPPVDGSPLFEELDGESGDVSAPRADAGREPDAAVAVDEWPFGAGNADTDGVADAQHDLVVGRGQTVTLPAGRTYDFRNLTILSDGILEIASDAGSWTVIGVGGDLLIDGALVARKGEYVGDRTVRGRTPAPDGGVLGEELSWYVAQAPGGGDNAEASQTGGNGGGGNSTERTICDGTCNGGTSGGRGANATEETGGPRG
jgi:hypothetical protein